MGSERSHITQNDTPLAPSAKQRKNEGNNVALQAKVDELETQNNKIAMKNEVLQEQYEKLFETLHETRRTQTHEHQPSSGCSPTRRVTFFRHGYP
ncbi:hypothetical protein ACFX2H_038159 [Malus domestica]